MIGRIVESIAFCNRGAFIRNVEGLGELAVRENFESLLVVGIEAFHLSGGVDLATQAIDGRTKCFAIQEAVECHAVQGHALGAGIGILVDEAHRGMGVADETARSGFSPSAIAGRIHQGKVGGHPGCLGPLQL